MRAGEIRVYPESDSLATAAAEAIAAALARKLAEAPFATIALAGGLTPKAVYSRLAEAPMRERIDWPRLRVFWGDERCVPPGHPDSNFGMARDALLDRVSVQEANIHRIPGELKPAEAAARAYEGVVRRNVPGDPDPRLDLVLLGLGEDGHTASLFPGTDWDADRLVVAGWVPTLEAHRISMTPRLFNAAHRVIFMVSGKAKAEAVARVIAGRPDCPAALIVPRPGELIWLLDRESSSKLEHDRWVAGPENA